MMLVRRKVRVWKREKVAKGMMVTMDVSQDTPVRGLHQEHTVDGFRDPPGGSSVSIAMIKEACTKNVSTRSRSAPLCCRYSPIKRQDRILDILIHKSSPQISLIKNRSSEALEHHDRVRKKCTGVAYSISERRGRTEKYGLDEDVG